MSTQNMSSPIPLRPSPSPPISKSRKKGRKRSKNKASCRQPNPAKDCVEDVQGSSHEEAQYDVFADALSDEKLYR